MFCVVGAWRLRRWLFYRSYRLFASKRCLSSAMEQRRPRNRPLRASPKFAGTAAVMEGRVGGGHVGATFHGGGGFRGPVVHSGGFRSVAPAFRSGGFRSSGLRAGVRAAPAFHGGGLRYGGQRYGGYRRHFHRGYAYGPAYYDEPSYYYYPRQCRIVWTYHGPRRVCHYRHWHRRYHHRHYHHRRHHFGFRFVW
jgi:hypothetical protein